MRELQSFEINQVAGGFDFGCDFVGPTEMGGISAGFGAPGNAWGVATYGTAMGAALVGYNAGTAVSTVAGFCPAPTAGGDGGSEDD